MKLAKKSLTIFSLCTLGLVIAMLIGAVFGLEVFKGNMLYTLLSLSTFTVAGAFAINSLNIFEKKRVVAIISLIFIAISVVFALIIYWSAFNVPVLFGKITIMVAVTTIFFIIIVSINNKVGNSYKALQAITYLIIIFIDVVIALSVWELSPFNLPFFTEIFIVACIVTFGLLCTLSILGKKPAENLSSGKKDGFMRITVEEYNNMQNEIANLKKEIEILKGNKE